MKVLICGGRDFTDTAMLVRALDDLSRTWGPDVVVIEGDAGGADRMAGYWARKRRFEDRKFKADWAQHGKAAGPIRNQKMLDVGKPDLVVAFPGGRGTADMIARARAAKIAVVEVVA